MLNRFVEMIRMNPQRKNRILAMAANCETLSTADYAKLCRIARCL